MQPFQIIKVRLANQSLHNPVYKGICDCFKAIIKEQGPKSFYKGTLSLLLGYGIQGSIAFGFNEIFKKIIRYVDQQYYQQNGLMPMSHVLLSGILTGIVSTIALTPADHIKTLLQKKGQNKKFKGSIEAGRYIHRFHGLKGLYLGFNSTLLREILSNAVYFYSYEYMMRLFASQGQSSSSAPIQAAFLAGGIAGFNSWLFTYPIDYIKTIIQSQNIEKLKYKNSIHCAKQQIQIEGYEAFTKGLGITLLRSFPVNGVAFLSYELVRRKLDKKIQ